MNLNSSSRQTPDTKGLTPAFGRIGAAIAVVVAALMLSGTGCSVVEHETQATKAMIGSLAGGSGRGGTTNLLELVQPGVMREADLYAGRVAQAADEFRARVPTAEARDMAMRWKLMGATAAFINATGELAASRFSPSYA